MASWHRFGSVHLSVKPSEMPYEMNFAPRALFDFEIPGSQDLTETGSTLADLKRFLIADLRDPNTIPDELPSSYFKSYGPCSLRV
jgi:hypothetical protein